MYKWVTPSLAVCDEADWPERFRLGEAKWAADWILAGGDAYVDSDETAALVLSTLGLTNAEVEDRLRFANTGVAS
jgi:hypothetical protein